MAELNKYIDERGRINFEALIEAADKSIQEKSEKAKADFHEKMNKLNEPQREFGRLLDKLAETNREKKEAEAQQRIKEEQEKANAEIESRIRKELNAEQETDLDRAYKILESALMSNHPTKGA